MAKGSIIRALLRMKHSPAGKRHLAERKKKKAAKTQPVYFKHIKRKSDVQRLRDAGLSEKDLKSLGIK